MVRYFMQLQYDGTDFHGWQYQPNAISVQEIIEEKLSLLMRKTTKVTGCGRTDTGVHASDYWLHFNFEVRLEDIEKTRFKLNNMLPHSIAIKQLLLVGEWEEGEETSAEKNIPHARFTATDREYKYFVHYEKSPFLKKYGMLSFYQLDEKKMNEAAEILLHHKDFSAFERTGADNTNSLCSLRYAKWEWEGEQLVFTICANRFLRNMVRAIVGTMMEVGRGRMTVEEFEQVIESKDRRNAGTSAPANGLFLTRVLYPFL